MKKTTRNSLAFEATFRDHPILTIRESEDDRFPFQFGVLKARLILSHIEEIKKFVEKHK